MTRGAYIYVSALPTVAEQHKPPRVNRGEGPTLLIRRKALLGALLLPVLFVGACAELANPAPYVPPRKAGEESGVR